MTNELSARKILVLYFANYKSRKYKENFYYWLTTTDFQMQIVRPMQRIFNKVDAINFFEVIGEEGIAFLNKFIVDYANDLKPDYLLWCSLTHEIFPSTFRKTREMEAKIIGLSFDDAWRSDTYVKYWLSYVDILLFNNPSFIEHYRNIKTNSIFSAFPSASPVEFYKINEAQKKYDVSFVGSFTEYRKSFIDYLRQNSIDVKVFGDGWDGSHFIPHDEMIKVLNQSKINLNIYEKPNRETLVNDRIFEIAMTGNCLITERPKAIANFFIEDENIITFSSKEELLQKVIYYLRHEDERKRIEQNMCEHALRNHSAETKLKEIFSEIEQLEYSVGGLESACSAKSLKSYLILWLNFCIDWLWLETGKLKQLSAWLRRPLYALLRRLEALGRPVEFSKYALSCLAMGVGQLRERKQKRHFRIFIRDLLYLINPENYF
jgi:hypothetical protein